MERNKHLTLFLKAGFLHGISSGCVSSLIFIVLVIVAFGIATDSFSAGMVLAVYIAILYGFFPALIIACIFGLISGLVFYALRDHLTNEKRSLTVSIILSLVVALPAISFWWAFFFSGFEIERMRFTGLINLLFVPFCIGVGLYVGNKLHKAILNSSSKEI